MDLVSGFIDNRFVSANTEPVYYMFSKNANGNYKNVGTTADPIYQLIGLTDVVANERYAKVNVRYMNGGMHSEIYTQNNLGAYVIDDKTEDYRLITQKELDDIAANKKGCIAAKDRFALSFSEAAISGDITRLELYKKTAGLTASGTKFSRLAQNIGDGSELGTIEKDTYYAFNEDANGL
ncbi:MAG: hypothetical protein RR338_06725, partial [Clostridia bacterium]